MAEFSDITKENLPDLLRDFYAQALPDPVIGHFFTVVADLDVAAHLPVITSFWEGVLFGTGGYRGNPMSKHFDLHVKSAMKPEHFERWLTVWEALISSRHQGPIAEMAVLRAQSIASIMEFKASRPL